MTLFDGKGVKSYRSAVGAITAAIPSRLGAIGAYGIANALPAGASAILVIIYAASMPLAEFGRYSVLSALVGFCACIADLALPAGFQRDYYDRHAGTGAIGFLSNSMCSLRILMLGALPLLGVLLFLFWPLTIHSLDRTLILLVLVLCITYFERLGEALGGTARALELPDYFVLLRAASAASAIVLALLIVLGFKGGVAGALLSRALAGITAYGICQITMNRKLGMTAGRFVLRELKPAFKFGLPVMAARLGSWGQQQALRPALSLVTSMSAVGYYSFASAIATMPMLLSNAIELAMAPIYFKRRAQDAAGFDAKIKTISTALSAGQAVLWLGLALFSGEIIALIGGPKYAPSAPIASLLFCGGFARVTGMHFGRQIQYLRKTIWLPALSLPCAFFSLFVACTWGPTYGIVVAAWGALISEIVLALLMAAVVYRFESLNMSPRVFMLFQTVMLGLVIAMGPGGIIAANVFIRLGVYIACCGLVFAVWVWPDRSQLRAIASR